MAHFRKLPREVEAVRWTGENLTEIQAFTGEDKFQIRTSSVGTQQPYVYAEKEHGWIPCPVGHWVIKGVHGEFHPCDPDVFDETYERM